MRKRETEIRLLLSDTTPEKSRIRRIGELTLKEEKMFLNQLIEFNRSIRMPERLGYLDYTEDIVPASRWNIIKIALDMFCDIGLGAIGGFVGMQYLLVDYFPHFLSPFLRYSIGSLLVIIEIIINSALMFPVFKKVHGLINLQMGNQNLLDLYIKQVKIIMEIHLKLLRKIRCFRMKEKESVIKTFLKFRRIVKNINLNEKFLTKEKKITKLYKIIIFIFLFSIYFIVNFFNGYFVFFSIFKLFDLSEFSQTSMGLFFLLFLSFIQVVPRMKIRIPSIKDILFEKKMKFLKLRKNIEKLQMSPSVLFFNDYINIQNHQSHRKSKH